MNIKKLSIIVNSIIVNQNIEVTDHVQNEDLENNTDVEGQDVPEDYEDNKKLVATLN